MSLNRSEIPTLWGSSEIRPQLTLCDGPIGARPLPYSASGPQAFNGLPSAGGRITRLAALLAKIGEQEPKIYAKVKMRHMLGS